MGARGRSAAVLAVSEAVGRPTTWDAISRAWRRQTDAGKEVGTAAEHLGADTWAIEPARVVKTHNGEGSKHLIIPDTQVKPGVPLDHFRWIGRYIREKQPRVVIHLGDHWDMPSLSSYESTARRASAGRAKMADIEAGNRALEVLEEAMGDFKPERKILLEGNHDGFAPQGRVGRYLDEHPEDQGLINPEQFADSWLGWERVPFLQPIEIDGVLYCHLFPLNRDGAVTGFGLRRGAASAKAQVQAVGQSCTAGHKQGLDTSIYNPPYSAARRGVIAGSCYMHEEEYLGPGRYWRGILVKHDVRPENPNHYDLLEVSLEYLKRRHG